MIEEYRKLLYNKKRNNSAAPADGLNYLHGLCKAHDLNLSGKHEGGNHND